MARDDRFMRSIAMDLMDHFSCNYFDASFLRRLTSTKRLRPALSKEVSLLTSATTEVGFLDSVWVQVQD
jgi:hypothetical protein